MLSRDCGLYFPDAAWWVAGLCANGMPFSLAAHRFFLVHAHLVFWWLAVNSSAPKWEERCIWGCVSNDQALQYNFAVKDYRNLCLCHPSALTTPKCTAQSTDVFYAIFFIIFFWLYQAMHAWTDPILQKLTSPFCLWLVGQFDFIACNEQSKFSQDTPAGCHWLDHLSSMNKWTNKHTCTCVSNFKVQMCFFSIKTFLNIKQLGMDIWEAWSMQNCACLL